MITKIDFSNKMNDIFLRYILLLNEIGGMFLKSIDLRGEKGTKEIDAGL